MPDYDRTGPRKGSRGRRVGTGRNYSAYDDEGIGQGKGRRKGLCY